MFSDLYLVKLKGRPSLYEYEVMYYSQEHQSFGTLTSFVDPFIDGEEIEVFIPRDDIVAWTSFQRIDEEHKEKTAIKREAKYKLTQFEYDLLSVHKDYKTYNNIANQIHLFKMREKGYFRDVDTKIPIREILDNCEVVG